MEASRKNSCSLCVANFSQNPVPAQIGFFVSAGKSKHMVSINKVLPLTDRLDWFLIATLDEKLFIGHGFSLFLFIFSVLV